MPLTVTPFGKTFLAFAVTAVGTWTAFYYLSPFAAAVMLVSVSWLICAYVVRLGKAMQRSHRELHHIIALMVESHLPAAGWYDNYVQQNMKDHVPMPRGATQIVEAIAQTARDLGDLPSDEFRRRALFRIAQLPGSGTETPADRPVH
jgi:hypothetical protein